MSSAVLSSGSSFTITLAVKTLRSDAQPSHKLVTFPGVDGAEILAGESIYESYEVTGWIGSTKLGTLNTQMNSLQSVYKNLRGRDTDTLVITYDDASSLTIKNLVGVTPPRYGAPVKYSTNVLRPVTFTVQRVK